MGRTYLDFAAATPASREAQRVYQKASRVYGNPSSPHTEGRAAKDILEDARVRIARLASVKSDAVLFTSGATEANALAILGQMRALAKERAPSSIHGLYLPSAHASTRGAMEMLEAEGFSIEPLVLKDGAIDYAALKNQIKPHTALIALEAVCGETGTIFPVREVRRALPEGSRIRIHVDASQLPRVGPFELTRLGADTLSLDAQKVGGVRGTGVLIAPRSAAIEPLIIAGGQERGLRPGTESHAGAVAFAAALEATHETRDRFLMRARRDRDALKEVLQREIPYILWNEGKEQAPHIMNLSLQGRDTDYIQALLDEAGFAVSTRSACATDAEGSEAVRAFTGDAARAASTIRISWGAETPSRDLTRFASALIRAVRFVDQGTV